MLDRDRLAAMAERGPRPVFATISGAHLYGFASADSDVDLRGAFLLSAKELLGLRPPPETFSIDEVTDMELDWVAHDLRKFARLMTRHNGYVLEQLFSPLVVVETPLFHELRELGRGCVTKGCARHYRGFARGRMKRLAEPKPTVKHLLYAYRVLLSGIHLMNTGECVSYLPELAAGKPHVAELVARKRGGTENMALRDTELREHLARLHDLEEHLEMAQERSALPDEPTSVAALDDFVVRARLA